jgi:hypothetical protein
LSSHLDIQAVYLGDIVSRYRQVRNSQGWNNAMAQEFKENGMSIHRLWEGVLSCEDEALLSRISDADRLAGEDAD